MWFDFFGFKSAIINNPFSPFCIFFFLVPTVLRDDFREEPADSVAVTGDTVVLGCLPPRAYPLPTVQWMKDEMMLTPNERVQLMPDGNLMISEVSLVAGYVLFCGLLTPPSTESMSTKSLEYSWFINYFYSLSCFSSQVRTEDEGTFTCTAQNMIGSRASRSAMLTVRGMNMITPHCPLPKEASS